jgi:hypothetical protein
VDDATHPVNIRLRLTVGGSPVESRAMPFNDIRRAAVTCLIAATLTVGPALDADQADAQSVQYKSPEGVEYRSLPDTDAVKTARAALDADPKNIARIIDLGVAQSGARQFREAIATFTRGLEIEPNNALLLRWRGHRYLSVREFDRAFADLSRGSKIDPSIYGNWYHLGIVQFVREDFAGAAASFAKPSPSLPMPVNFKGPSTGCGCRSAAPAVARKRSRCSIGCSIGDKTLSPWITRTHGV